MASDGKDFKQDITADPTNFLAGWQKAVAGAASGAEAMKSSIGKVGEAFSALQKPLMVIGAALAGGAFFKDAIGAANKLNGESMALAKSLGITGTEASALNTALGDIGSDSETYIDAFQKFAKQLKNNEAGLQAMGLQTRDSNGHLRDSNTLFTEALSKVGNYKPGLDQTTAAMTLFGKGVNEVMTLQKLDNKIKDEAREKNEALGLTMTKEGVQASKEYKLAMNDVDDVFQAIKKTIAEAVMPIFTELARWFSDVGPTAVFVFKVAIDVVATALRSFVGLVRAVADVAKGLLNPLFEFGAGFKKLIQGDVVGARDQMEKAFTGWGTAIANAWDKAGDDLKRTATDVSNIWGKGTEVEAPGKGTKTMGDFGKTNGKPKSRMGDWEAHLAETKAGLERQGMLEGQYREMSKAEELKYWSELKSRKDLNEQERIAVSRKTAEVEMSMIKEGFDVKVATLQAEAAAYKNNTDERLRIEREIQSKYQEGTKQYEESAKRINEIQKQAAEQDRAVAASRVQAERDARLQTIALEEQTLQTTTQLGLVNQQQVLQAQAEFENRRNTIALEALNQRLADAEKDRDRNKVEIEKINTEKEALERAHQLRLGQIKQAQAVEDAKYQTQFFQGMQNSMQGALTNIMKGTQTIGQGIRSVFQSVGQMLAQIGAQIAATWISNQIKEMIFGEKVAASKITTLSAEAGAGGVASMAAAPYPLNLSAPEFGAAMATLAASFAPAALMSAAGGFDIPSNINPLVQTHASEMILPAKYADVIRNMATQTGASGGNSNITINIASPIIGNVASQSDVVSGMQVVKSQILAQISRAREYGGAV